MGNLLLVDLGKPWLWTLSGWGSTEDALFPSSSQHSLHWVSGRAKLPVILYLRPLKILAVPITVTRVCTALGHGLEVHERLPSL